MAKKYPNLSKVLKKLLFDKDMKPAELARAVDMPVPTVHRLVTGKSTRPYQSSIDAISAFFDISQAQLLGEEPLATDTVSHDEPSMAVKTAKPTLAEHHIKTIPLVPWNKVTGFHENHAGFEHIPCLNDLSDDSFAVIMPDSSMSPIFDKGCMLIFDPVRKANDRSFVLVHIHDTNTYVFRQLLIDMEHRYLKPLNPDLNAFKMRLLAENDVIIATLVESRQIYGDTDVMGGHEYV
jgi:SOS-response transcriptional repressor LexA